MLTLFNHERAVNDDIFDAFGILMGILKRCLVDHALGTKDRDVCFLPGLEQASIFNPKFGGIQRSHLFDSVLQGQHSLFTDILSEDSWKGAVPTRMRFAFSQNAIRPNSGAIRSD